MEQYFSNLFENISYERSLILFLSLTDPNIIRQTKFTDHEKSIIKDSSLEKLHRQRILKEQLAIALLEAELEWYSYLCINTDSNTYFRFNKWVHMQVWIVNQNY